MPMTGALRPQIKGPDSYPKFIRYFLSSLIFVATSCNFSLYAVADPPCGTTGRLINRGSATIVLKKNVLKPLTLLLLPKTVNYKNRILGVFSDAIYCSTDAYGVATILAQVTKPGRQYGRYLMASDCSLSTQEVAYRVNHPPTGVPPAAGADAIMKFKLKSNDNDFEIMGRAVDVSSSSIFEFPLWQLFIMEYFSFSFSSANLCWQDNQIQEPYSLALHFEQDGVDLGLFFGEPIFDTWWRPAQLENSRPPRTENVGVFVLHRFITYMTRTYPGVFATSIPNPIDPTQQMPIYDISYNYFPTAARNGPTGVTIHARADLSGLILTAQTSWTGTPLVDSWNDANSIPGSSLLHRWLTGWLNGYALQKPLAPVLKRSIGVVLNNNPGSFTFIADYAAANNDYVYFSGNGGLDLQPQQ